MRTAKEALFLAMFQEGWFIETAGDDEFGYSFGYVTNDYAEVSDIIDAFADVVESYGKPDVEDMAGEYVATLYDNGRFDVVKVEPGTGHKTFATHLEAYSRYLMGV